jgi:hypothetical protein
MDLSSAVQWWEEWQLRILVLGSLFVQIFLYFSAWVRTLSLPIPVMRVLRVLVWVAYIGGDALAVYALATLFNRHNEQQQGQTRRSDNLEVLWAPVLLIHLGGQLSISAYSLEDNELWMRHTMAIVSQVTIACYVFYKQWRGSSGERRLLQAAVLLFIVGIIKFGQKPWALRSASFNNLLASTAKIKSPPYTSTPVPSPACWNWSCKWRIGFFLESIALLCTYMCIPLCALCSYMDIPLPLLGLCMLTPRQMGRHKNVQGAGEDEEPVLSLQEYVRDAKRCVNAEAGAGTPTTPVSILDISSPTHHANYICKMFVDLPIPYFGRLRELQSFQRVMDEDERTAYHMLQHYLLNTYGLLYTMSRSAASPLGFFLLLLLPLLASAAAVLFSMSPKDGYHEDDVWATYILFYCTAAQEFIYILLPFLPCPCLHSYGFGRWSDMVYQHSLLSFCARKKQPTLGLKLAALDCFREYINKHWYIWQVPAALPITQLVSRHVRDDGWKEYVSDAASYRRFNNLRGQRTVSLWRSQQQHHQLGRQLGRCLDDVPFDESVLLWHIATDLCFHHKSSTTTDADATQRMSREISNYMIYLLFIRPDMLMTGTRPGLFTDVSNEIELILEDSETPQSSNTEEGLFAREIKDTVMERLSPSNAHMARKTKGLLIGKACMLAEVLMTELHDEKERWQVIQGVWVEMLCYSASRCTGYLHARSLGEGGEYLSYVWLLWFLMGMETLADRHQRPEPPKHEEEDDNNYGPSASTSQRRLHQSVEICEVRDDNL